MPPSRENRLLPQKEAKLFREVLVRLTTDYENRAYKKGLKSCDVILKKQPDHGETMCMKGIILFNMGRKQEGHEFVRKGVAMDMTSHICWHVKALIHKAEKELDQAMACYIQALKIDKDQINVIRDLVLIMLQFRHYYEAIEHRTNLLRLQPKQRSNWLGLAVLYHLAGEHERAHQILSRFEAMQAGDSNPDYDASEVALYHALVLEEAGKPNEAIHHLNSISERIIDKQALEMARARLNMALGAVQNSMSIWTWLLDDNPDSQDILEGYLSCRGFSKPIIADEERQTCLGVLDDLALRYPRSLVIRRAALQFAQDHQFTRRADAYIKDALTKGIPSLYVDIRALFRDDDKRRRILTLLEGYRDNLFLETVRQSDEAFTPLGQRESPTAYLWAQYFLAQHHSAQGSHALALESIDAAIGHTPTLPELYIARARILKRAGDNHAASRSMEQARSLDGQDRFLNCKSAKYLCRCGHPEQAEVIAGQFTRIDAVSPLSDMLDMQALWFLLEQGDAYRRLGRLHLSLKRYHQIEKIFSDWADDEYDFHSWCLRKHTLRAYVHMVRWENQSRLHTAFLRAAQGAMEIYLDLAKRQACITNGIHVNGSMESAAKLEEDRRKAEKKAKKASAKAKTVEAKKHATPPSNEGDLSVTQDDDPEGFRLLATDAPLDQAAKLLHTLERVAASHCATWLLSFRLAAALKRPLQSVRALMRARALQPTDVDVFVHVAELRASLAECKDELVIRSAQDLLMAPTIEVANAELLQRNPGSARHIFATARSLIACKSPPADIEAVIFQLLSSHVRDDRETCERALMVLKEELASSQTDNFRLHARKRYPLATAFFSESELQASIVAQTVEDAVEIQHRRIATI